VHFFARWSLLTKTVIAARLTNAVFIIQMDVTSTLSSHYDMQLISRVVKAKAVPPHATKALGGEEVSSYSFSTSALDEGEWSASRPGRASAPGKGPPVPIVQETGWVPDTEARGEILSPMPGIEPRSPGRPAHSQTPY
jgi:hypothetical protein